MIEWTSDRVTLARIFLRPCVWLTLLALAINEHFLIVGAIGAEAFLLTINGTLVIVTFRATESINSNALTFPYTLSPNAPYISLMTLVFIFTTPLASILIINISLVSKADTSTFAIL